MNNEFEMIQMKNQLTGECLYAYTPGGRYYLKTAVCDSTARSQIWMWIDRSPNVSKALQSLYNTGCVTPTACSSAEIDTNDCDTGNFKQNWLVRNNLLVNDGCAACMTTSFNSDAYLAQCGGNNFQYWDFITVSGNLVDEPLIN